MMAQLLGNFNAQLHISRTLVSTSSLTRVGSASPALAKSTSSLRQERGGEERRLAGPGEGGGEEEGLAGVRQAGQDLPQLLPQPHLEQTVSLVKHNVLYRVQPGGVQGSDREIWKHLDIVEGRSCLLAINVLVLKDRETTIINWYYQKMFTPKT